MTETVDALIVGAGLSGLVAASHHRFAALLDELALERFASHYGERGVFHWRGSRVEAPLAKDFAASHLFFKPESLGLPAAGLQRPSCPGGSSPALAHNRCRATHHHPPGPPAPRLALPRGRLGASVQAIDQNSHGVCLLDSSGERHYAANAIVAIPQPLRLAIRFEPALPAALRALLQRSPMGAMTKILAIYARPFWREQGLNGLGIGDLPFLELTADSGPPEGQPAVLAGFIAGERALRHGAMPALQRRQLVIDDLVAY